MNRLHKLFKWINAFMKLDELPVEIIIKILRRLRIRQLFIPVVVSCKRMYSIYVANITEIKRFSRPYMIMYRSLIGVKQISKKQLRQVILERTMPESLVSRLFSGSCKITK